MFEWLILIFILYIIYLTMKKPKATIEKPVPKVEAETPVEAVAAEPAAPAAPVAAKATAKKPSPEKKAPKKAQAATPKPVEVEVEVKVEVAEAVAPAITVSERVGLTAGSIWHYLSENGPTPVAKLLRELTEEEKICQRSIGWLAQEDKITLAVFDRVETIALKE